MKIILFILFLGLLSCSKQSEPLVDNKCYYACLISDKYTGDSVFVVRDTIWKDECLTKYWWDKTKAANDSIQGLFTHCNPFYRNGKLAEREMMFYVLDKNKIIQPKVF